MLRNGICEMTNSVRHASRTWLRGLRLALEAATVLSRRPAPEPHHQAHGQQQQCAPAQPHQSRSQMRSRGERHTEASADGEIGGYAQRTLWHQRKRNTGQRPCCRAARPAREPPLPGRPNGRGGVPSARTNRMRRRIVRSRHPCASSRQQEEAAGLPSYSSCRFTQSTVLPSVSRSLRPFGARSRK
jgi:hypothetical protein